MVSLRKYKGTFEYLEDSNKEDNESNWVTVNSFFSYFVSSSQAFISQTVKSSPLAIGDDGFTDVVYMSESTGASKYRLAKLLINQDEGDYFKKDFELKDNGKLNDNIKKGLEPGQGIEYIKTKEYKLIPENKEGFFSIDGEKYKSNGIHLKVKQQCLRVFGYKKQ